LWQVIGKLIGGYQFIGKPDPNMARTATTSGQGEVTILANATSKSQSLRTTVPIGIIRQLGLREGDRLVWALKPDGNQLVVIVSPMRDGQNSESPRKHRRQ
jgi:hypothetical protein